MASSPAEFRSKTPRRPIVSVTIPGTDLIVDCRRPELFTMAVTGLFSWPALDRVQELTKPQTEAAAPIFDNRPQPTIFDKAKDFGTFLDEWVVAAAVAPVFVLLEMDAVGDLLWVGDLPYEGRLAIWNATVPKTAPTVTSFRSHESDGDAAGPSGEAVRDAPVDPPEGQG